MSDEIAHAPEGVDPLILGGPQDRIQGDDVAV